MFPVRPSPSPPLLADSQGPEIRTGFLANKKSAELTRGQELELTTDYEFLGDNTKVGVGRVVDGCLPFGWSIAPCGCIDGAHLLLFRLLLSVVGDGDVKFVERCPPAADGSAAGVCRVEGPGSFLSRERQGGLLDHDTT